MNPQNTIILGNGYVSSAYQKRGYWALPNSEFYYNGHNFETLIPHLIPFDNIVNCVAKADTNWTEDPANFGELWRTNVEFVKHLSEYCEYTKKKFVHISTTDLYGNLHDVDINVETRRDLDLNTDYRFSKFASERVCNAQDLILRIRLPFDDQLNTRNLLVKLTKFRKFFHLSTDVTYLPDLVSATEILVKEKQQGIFNIVSEDSTSMLYIARNLLELPAAKTLDPHYPDENIVLDFDQKHVNNIASIGKLLKFYKPVELESTIINCYNTLLTKGLTIV